MCHRRREALREAWGGPPKASSWAVQAAERHTLGNGEGYAAGKAHGTMGSSPVALQSDEHRRVGRSTPSKGHVEVYWFKAIIKFWNATCRLCFDRTAGLGGCDVLREVIKADIELANTKPDVRCWTAEVVEALGILPGGQGFVASMKGKKEIDWSKFTNMLHANGKTVWDGRHGRKW